MAVDALELRPRTTVALLDAAVRLCGRALGVWSIVLPAGAVLVWALFDFVEAARLHRTMSGPAALLASAWLLRAVAQGAACHHLERTVVGPGEPDAWRSWKAALARLPSLLVVCAHNLALNAALFLLTAGLGLLFISAHGAGYAVALRGEGHPLATYSTCARLLGPARHASGWVRLAGLAQLLVGLNLHLGADLLLKASENLLALDVSFADRFCSLDNPVWVAVLASVTFTLFEPLRAATATLLLVDGRVRQEGLDLSAAVEQLPRRRRSRAASAAGATLLLALLGAPAQAQPQGAAPKSLPARLRAVAQECDAQNRPRWAGDLERLQKLPASEQAALSRFVSRLERLAFDDGDCESAAAQLEAGLAFAARAAPQGDAAAARGEVKKILERPEFAVAPTPGKPEEAEKTDTEPPGWLAQLWEDFWKALLRWLREGNQRDPLEVSPPAPGLDLGLTNAVVLGAVVLVLAVLVALLLKARGKKGPAEAESLVAGLGETALGADPMSALSRPPEGWAELADALASQGQFREATRHLYLALLSRLHRDGAIDYDPAKSNWDYFRGFRGAREIVPPFRELTSRFDFAWYGNLDVSAQAYAAFRGLTRPLLAPREPGHA